MKIVAERSGGFAGLKEQLASVDTADLDPAARVRVEDLVRRMRFFDLPPVVPGGAVGADLFHYEITVTDGGRRHTVAFVEDDSPQTAPLRALVEALQT